MQRSVLNITALRNTMQAQKHRSVPESHNMYMLHMCKQTQQQAGNADTQQYRCSHSAGSVAVWHAMAHTAFSAVAVIAHSSLFAVAEVAHSLICCRGHTGLTALNCATGDRSLLPAHILCGRRTVRLLLTRGPAAPKRQSIPHSNRATCIPCHACICSVSETGQRKGTYRMPRNRNARAFSKTLRLHAFMQGDSTQAAVFPCMGHTCLVCAVYAVSCRQHAAGREVPFPTCGQLCLTASWSVKVT
jgi:hypothetical protein